MPESIDARQAATSLVVEFLEKLWPFAGIGRGSLEKLATNSLLGFYPVNTIILRQDERQPDHVFLIERGAVRLYRPEAAGNTVLVDCRGEGSLFGAAAIVGEVKSSLIVEAAEDTFCFLLGRDQFLEFVRDNPIFIEHYFRSFSEDLVCKTYSQLDTHIVRERLDEGLYPTTARVGDAVRHQPQMIEATETVTRAAQRMTEADVNVLLVGDRDNGIVGTLSDKDIRAKIVALRADYDQPVASVMTHPAADISAQSTCLDAVLEMMKLDIQHLVVRQGSDIVGVVSAQDILAFQEVSPLLLMKDIDAQDHVQGLCELGRQVPRLVKNLVDVGTRANSITRIISVLNDRILGRLLTLLQEELGPSPVPFCWMVMGSEGRMEQTLRTDQDNAILYDNPGESWEKTKAAKLYFRALGNEAIKHLIECGYPLCKGNYMASSARWRKPLSVWTGYFDEWMSTAGQDEILNAKIFFDFRCVFGSEELERKLKDHVIDRAQRSKFFINRLSRDSFAIRPPLSFLRNFIVESDGEHKNRLDLKMRGLVPVVDFARAMALEHGFQETNTTARLLRLQDEGHVPEELCSEVIDAYGFLMHLRLVHQLRMMKQGQEPHNFLNPGDLSDLEKQTLKGAFGVINRMQTYMAKIRAEI